MPSIIHQSTPGAAAYLRRTNSEYPTVRRFPLSLDTVGLADYSEEAIPERDPKYSLTQDAQTVDIYAVMRELGLIG